MGICAMAPRLALSHPAGNWEDIMKMAKWIDVSKASYFGCRITVAFVLVAFLAGCGGGGGGGGGVSPGGVSKVDLHGDSAGPRRR